MQSTTGSTTATGTSTVSWYFAVAEYTLGISDFTTDPPSVIPLSTAHPIRAEHDTYPVSVAVGPATKKWITMRRGR